MLFNENVNLTGYNVKTVGTSFLNFSSLQFSPVQFQHTNAKEMNHVCNYWSTWYVKICRQSSLFTHTYCTPYSVYTHVHPFPATFHQTRQRQIVNQGKRGHGGSVHTVYITFIQGMSDNIGRPILLARYKHNYVIPVRISVFPPLMKIW